MKRLMLCLLLVITAASVTIASDPPTRQAPLIEEPAPETNTVVWYNPLTWPYLFAN